MSKKIAIALSGGVDSSVTAHLLKKAGADLTAVYIRFYARNEAETNRINVEEKLAAKVADQLDIKFTSLDFSSEQKKTVVEYFLKNYQAGKSPNPCLECNRLLKFAKFGNWADSNGFDAIATGHYSKIIEKNGQYYLGTAYDRNKDQSYFLYQLKEEQLSKIIFPLGSLLKTQVRQIAKKANLISTESKESFDVCFLNQTNPKAFLEENLGINPGELVDRGGNILGKHRGLHLYTIGQRQGFQINHRLLKESMIEFDQNKPPALFVIAKNIKKNELVLGTRKECLRQEFKVKNLHFVNQQSTKKEKLYAQVKVRNTGRLIACQITIESPVEARIKTQEKIFALAAGQAAVFYQQLKGQTIVLGGGEIK